MQKIVQIADKKADTESQNQQAEPLMPIDCADDHQYQAIQPMMRRVEAAAVSIADPAGGETEESGD